MTGTGQPAYGEVRRVTSYAAVLLARNPGPMTLDGTNTWLLGSGDVLVVVDPGPDDGAHLEAVAAAGTVELILLTHGHPDHSEGAQRLHELTGAPVRAAALEHCHGGGPLRGTESIEAGGLTLDVLTTPGHTSDSVCLILPEAVLTGDTILGRGTTVVAHPDGVLADYLASLRRLVTLGERLVLPGHGPELPSVAAAAATYLEHREQRLAQVRDAAERLGPDVPARTIVEAVYADVDRSVWDAAELSVLAQLDYLRSARAATSAARKADADSP